MRRLRMLKPRLCRSNGTAGTAGANDLAFELIGHGHEEGRYVIGDQGLSGQS